jgi:hypothetical protein
MKRPDNGTKVLAIPLPQMVIDDLANVRKEAKARIGRLIEFLDVTDPYVSTELEDEVEDDDNPDNEPSLGAAETINQQRSWLSGQNPTRDDREEQNEDGDDLDRREASDLDIYGEADQADRSI